ncbi:hypothetical protein [Kingella potus]|uniref:hypothetical protein n=1 Tax=Kingella potus TaxID=265175 RepID=UPI001FD154AE|nr:hypothetical protein [Kingella potus]UOP00216.1 hypothetical protein LVJ84_09800 [Kingella potus]
MCFLFFRRPLPFVPSPACGGGLGWGLLSLGRHLQESKAAGKAVLQTTTPSPTLPRANAGRE